MSVYRNGNYSAFYVAEPFSESNLGAAATRDLVYYNMLRAWKEKNNSFPFVDSHNKTYNVRDSSSWEYTLKPRLHERLNNSKNILLFLSKVTKESRALVEEIEYGIITIGLPVIVIYPDYHEKDEIVDNNGIKQYIKKLWDNLPIFKDSMGEVATLHIPLKKELIKSALNDSDFMVNSVTKADTYYYKL